MIVYTYKILFQTQSHGKKSKNIGASKWLHSVEHLGSRIRFLLGISHHAPVFLTTNIQEAGKYDFVFKKLVGWLCHTTGTMRRCFVREIYF